MKKKVSMLGGYCSHNPLYPPYLKGDSEGEYPYFKGEIEKESFPRQG